MDKIEGVAVMIESDDIDQQAAMEAEIARREEVLNRIASFGETMRKMRDEAVSARAESGIELEWLEDEEYYEGIDDGNRDFYRNRGKPLSPEGGSDRVEPQKLRSKIFLNITAPYVDAAAAKVADMLLPTDEQNWGIEETPIPRMVDMENDNTPVVDLNGQPVVKLDGQPYTVADYAKIVKEKAKDAVKAAEKRIDDWTAECNMNSHIRQLIEDAARIGTGVLKGPFPAIHERMEIGKEGGITNITKHIEVAPESRCVSAWNLFPDPACGNNIHNGSYIFERDTITKKQMMEFLDDETYIAEAVMRCLEQGPQKHKYTREQLERGVILDNDNHFEVWYGYSMVSKEDMEAAGCPCEHEYVDALVVLVNDVVIKAAQNPLDSGEFPYDVMPWRKRADHWAGIGISRQVRAPQRIVNSAVRNMMDNAGLTAGPQVAVRNNVVTPADGVWELTPRKVWVVNEEYEGRVEDFLTFFNVPAMQAELMNIIGFAQKMAEDISGLPALLQGQQGAAPETVGGMQMLINNANTVLRRIARNFDDMVTEPHINRYYEWLLMYGPEEEEKGDYRIIARGSSALVERDIQNQTIAQMGNMLANPAFGIDPKRWVVEYFKSQRLDPRTFQYTEEELQKMAEAQSQNPPEEPAVKVANIRAQVEQQRLESQRERDQAEREYRMQLVQIEREIAMLKLSADQNISLEKIKAQLATTAITEKTKRDLHNSEVAVKKTMGSGI